MSRGSVYAVVRKNRAVVVLFDNHDAARELVADKPWLPGDEWHVEEWPVFDGVDSYRRTLPVMDAEARKQ